jgi:hypothetical protein
MIFLLILEKSFDSLKSFKLHSKGSENQVNISFMKKIKIVGLNFNLGL